jgi:DNA-binding Lrp family transcriptional regulator
MPAPSQQTLDSLDRSIVVATQGGLPLVDRPYLDIAQRVGCTEAEVMSRMAAMLDSGVIRRQGVVPNHYAIGYIANGMSVWDVPDEMVDTFGVAIGRFEFVSHCYCRPRHMPEWPFNLFAMVHGKSRLEVEQQVGLIADYLGPMQRSHRVLYSTRILKKTGLRLAGRRNTA